MLTRRIRTLIKTLDFITQGKLAPLDPITEFDAVDVKHAFRHLQGGEHIGKIILNLPQDDSVLEAVAEVQPVSFRKDAAYFIPGGVGGLGRSLAIWLIERGAKHLVFLSRSAGISNDSRHLAAELESMGATATMVSGTINDVDDVKKAIAASPSPIRGVFQMAMVQRVRVSQAPAAILPRLYRLLLTALQDSPFIDLSWDDWTAAVAPKVQGTWNVHEAFLGHDLDFFWLASSTVTVVDQPGQGNYKAGSTFIESFCQYRHSLGLPASVLSICPIDDVGYVAENAYAKRSGIAQGMYFLGEREFLESVEATLGNSAPPAPGPAETLVHPPWHSVGHTVMGLRSELHLDDPKNPTNWRRDRRMGLYHNKPIAETAHGEAESSGLKTFLGTLAGGEAEAILAEESSVEFLAVETGRKIYDFLLRPETPVDTSLSLPQVGLDSLTAIELRRWFRQAFGLQISVLEIMGSASLKQLGETTAAKLKEKYTAST